MTTPEIGKVLKFAIPDNKDRYVLVIIIGDTISFYTGFESVDGLSMQFAEHYSGDSDEKIRDRIQSLYAAKHFHWAWHTFNGGIRVEEEYLGRYLDENNDPEITFDEWVEENYDINDLIGGN